jgi:hypothetical protein
MAGKTLSWPLAFDFSAVIVTGGTLVPEGALDAARLRARKDLPRKGLALPVGVNKRGSTKTVTSDANDRKIIAIGISDCHNSHAYQQDPGLGSDHIFALNDGAVRGIIIQRLRDIFADFENQNRYKLKEETTAWTEDGGELILDFDYFNIESDEEKHFKGPLQGA